MLDVHILTLPSTPNQWIGQCIDSVLSAAKSASFPVDVHVIPGTEGHIGKGRMEGYALGYHAYVTSVDDDDWVEPDAFESLRDALDSGVPAIYTHEWTWQNGKRGTHRERQNLRVFRRDVAQSIDLSMWPALDSTALIAHADNFGPYAVVKKNVYNYRIDPGSKARCITTNTPGIFSRARSLGAMA